jgi:ABC-type transporter Mla MlaB component
VTFISPHLLVIQAAGLPLAQEAALMYADGRTAEAERALTQAIEASGPQTSQAWEMLFDLYRTRGDWPAFEGLAKRFEQARGRPAPPWLDQAELGRLPPGLRHGGDACFEIAGVLDAHQATVLERARDAAARHTTLHLDLSKIQAVTGEGCDVLLCCLRWLTEHGNGLLLTGAERLAQLLRDAANGGAEGVECWLLALELYRLRGMQAEFERASLEYALAVGATPPDWQPALMPVVAPPPVQEKRDTPRYQSGPEVVRFDGTLSGANNVQIGELRQFGAQRQYVNINLAQLARMDLACATSFVDTVNSLAAAGKTVRLIRPNSLVRALLASFTLHARVALIHAKSI